MAMQAKRVNMKWYIIIAAIGFVVLLAYSSFRQSVVQYEVCMNFHGRSHCAEASGKKPSDAVRTAQEIDCELLANGRGENIACLDQQPSSVRALPGK
jgi:hypothetical protein